MAVIWIESDSSQRRCDLCASSDKLHTVPDCDRSTGYHGDIQICAECAETYSNHCGACR